MNTEHTEHTEHTEQPKARRGFAAMSPQKQREIASKGGRVAHEKGAAHEWSVDEARLAGRKGGSVRHSRRKAMLKMPPIDETVEQTETWSDA
jgi:general stress protein YciG